MTPEKPSNSSKVEVNEEIVTHNLAMMETDMQELAQTESMGGNAGTEIIKGKTYSCVALNGYANEKTGEILAFGNFQNIPEAIRVGNVEFTFRQLMNSEMIRAGFKNKNYKIVNFFGKEKFSAKGKATMEAAVRSYNAKQAWYL